MERKSRNNQGSSERALQDVPSSSITGFLGSSNKLSAHELVCGQGHELELKDYGDVYTCFGCKEKGFGPHHACRNESCTFCLHQECKSPRSTLSPPFFSELMSFEFCSEPKFFYCKGCNKEHSDTSCNACGMYVNGYFYRNRGDKKHLHPCCANLPQQIKCRSTGATMVLKQKSTSKCYYCKEIQVKRGIKHTSEAWSYESVGEDHFHLHVGCIIKMLSELKDDLGHNNHSPLQLTLNKNVSNGVPETNLHIAVRANTKKKWEERFAKFMKYAKIVLGAIISIFLGDPTSLLGNLIVTLGDLIFQIN